MEEVLRMLFLLDAVAAAMAIDGGGGCIGGGGGELWKDLQSNLPATVEKLVHVNRH